MSQNEPKMDIWDPFGYFGMPFRKHFLIISVTTSTLKIESEMRTAKFIAARG